MFASLRSRVAFVTGGGSGIGAATSLMFASQGVKVAVVDVNHEDAEGISQRIERLGGEAIAIAADISKPEQVQSAVLKTVEKFHRLDIAVNNAGIGGDQAETSDLAVDSWRRVNSINLDGVFYCMKYEIPEMLKNGGGSIINISSILGQVGFARASAYVAAKHGVVGLTQAAAIEYGPRKIRVNAVGPGFIRTPILSGLSEEMLKSMAQLHALKRIGEPDEVAALITFLASSEASFITGSYYAVDGGYLAS
ncbi:MAG: SDR family oxidoreductase [Actinobacteria bacterium]|jgi:NAD(P)-dependent dehydrogenase (short-subunit alcohol dehydrogenase family)|nr:SDR family oxidoreductase [Actinomycetota bacterium]NDB07726.1 SDR family oxidoreductase [Actinomycetota bacterium]NDI10195.1 SDR family oxidoreductase [Actinomycetota bacterium]